MNIISANSFIKERKLKIKKGLQIDMRDIGGDTKRKFIIEDSTFLICKHLNSENQPFKIFTFERLKALKPKGNVSYNTWETNKKTKHPNIEYRIGYYIIGKKGKANGKWWWGQSCPMIGHDDFIKLINKSYKDGIVLK